MRRYSFVKLWKFTYICTLRTGGGWEGESKFVPGPQCQANACKISRLWGVISSLVFNKSVSKLGNFTNFKTFFPVVSLACLSQKLKKKKMVWSALKEVHFWAAPPSIGHYREPLIGPPPPLPPLLRYKMWEFKNRHTNTRHVKACLAGAQWRRYFFWHSLPTLDWRQIIIFDALKRKGMAYS